MKDLVEGISYYHTFRYQKPSKEISDADLLDPAVTIKKSFTACQMNDAAHAVNRLSYLKPYLSDDDNVELQP